ncbi:plastid division protein PDV1-like isoform X1 [Apium graveolens]|uniref:plastid division protein PDV1-like isoform X1 n=1 Tax=Apium graveolens TaxID=4045 RepID=UPI003D797C79
MTWKMKVEEVECVLEKIWDLHDKLSDAIHSISRTHFLRSVNSSSLLTNSDDNRTGFVFIKGFPGNVSAIRDARSLNSIRTALENLQDQLEFVHSVQIQQLAERSVAIARLEQRRIVLALRLGEHQGKNYEVIDEARAFVGAVHDATNFASPVNVCGSAACPSGENCQPQDVKKSNVVVRVLIYGLNFAKKTIRVNRFNGILGNSALVSVTMLALLHMQKVSSRNTYISHLPQKQEDNIIGKNVTKISRPGRTSSNAFAHMDVLLARG